MENKAVVISYHLTKKGAADQMGSSTMPSSSSNMLLLAEAVRDPRTPFSSIEPLLYKAEHLNRVLCEDKMDNGESQEQRLKSRSQWIFFF